jgi:(p)ppGpp synthase/HD superfamily hydrolase
MEKIKTTPAKSRIQAAIDFATTYHRHQWRKESDVPYIIHPLQVVETLASWGIDQEQHEETWIAGVLHDVDEDTSSPLDEIGAVFGPSVRSIVAELSFRVRGSQESGRDFAWAKSMYMLGFLGKCVQALVIKMADRMRNVGDFIKGGSDYAVKYWDKAKALFEAFITRFDEVVDFYGRDVAEKIHADYTAMRHQIDTLRAA